jgi:hypothetical protein
VADVLAQLEGGDEEGHVSVHVVVQLAVQLVARSAGAHDTVVLLLGDSTALGLLGDKARLRMELIKVGGSGGVCEGLACWQGWQCVRPAAVCCCV